ncbi:MAG: translation initiation factor IF-2, partial [Candidatus Thorarchaeota archaeon]
KARKVPFIVATTKVDRIGGWISTESACWIDTWPKQPKGVQEEFEERFYKIIGQLGSRGFNAERFDKVRDFTKTIAVVPCSGKTGEGVPELLVVLTGLAQQYLKDGLKLSNECRGVILEVKEVKGLGKTIDVIIYDGVARKGDYLVIGGKEPIVTKIKSLLKPRALKEIRVEKQFETVDEVRAASGVKIAAPDLEGVFAGLEIKIVKREEEAKKAALEMRKEYEEFEVSGEEGIILKADTIGALEALITLFKGIVPIKRAAIGDVTKKDVSEVESENNYQKLVVGFNVKVNEDALKFAKDHDITILTDDVVYKIIEDYEKWKKKRKKELEVKQLEGLTRPAKLQLLPNCTFRISKPAIVGVRIMSGLLNQGYLMNESGDRIGELKQIQSEGVVAKQAKVNQEVAISIDGPTVGRQIKEEDILYTDLSSDDYKKLLEVRDLLSDTELRALEEIQDIKRRKNPSWGF